MMWSKGDQNSKNSFFENEHRSKVWNSGRRDSSKKRKVFHFQHQVRSFLNQRQCGTYCWRRRGWCPVMHRRCNWKCRHYHFGFWSQNSFRFWEHHLLHPSPPSSEMRISLRDGGFIRRNLTQISILQAWYILIHASTKGTLFDVRPGRHISICKYVSISMTQAIPRSQRNWKWLSFMHQRPKNQIVCSSTLQVVCRCSTKSWSNVQLSYEQRQYCYNSIFNCNNSAIKKDI